MKKNSFLLLKNISPYGIINNKINYERRLIDMIKLRTVDKDASFNICIMNKNLGAIDFLLSTNSKNLSMELYTLMKKQISESFNSEYKFLNLTKLQLEIFNTYKINLRIFLNSPFNVDYVNVIDSGEIECKIVDNELNIAKLKEDLILNEDMGLRLVTGYGLGHMGKGIYGCDVNDEESYFAFNSVISDRVNILSRNEITEVSYAEGSFSGLYKKCLCGKLEGMVLLLDGIMSNLDFDKESLEYYEVDEDYSL